jgi:hypothetical protein
MFKNTKAISHLFYHKYSYEHIDFTQYFIFGFAHISVTEMPIVTL